MTEDADGNYSINFHIPVVRSSNYQWVLTDMGAQMSWDLGVKFGPVVASLDTWCGPV